MKGMGCLKVDVDDGRPLRVAELVRRLARGGRKLVALGQRRSPGGHGWHLWIRVRPAPRTATETVALQLLCGSDPARESYNMNRARRVDQGKVSAYWRRRWNVLYR